ncbi:kinase [Saccharopolyspora sp. NPDC002376]
MSSAIVLYGPPAAGKDTVNDALSRIDTRYEHFRRLKCGSGRSAGYRMISTAQLDELREQPGEVLWENRRYSSTYVVDRSELLVIIGKGSVPVIHLGQVEAVEAMTSAMPDVAWLVVELWCSRGVAARRIEERGTGDTAERLAAFDATERLERADLSVRTDQIEPDAAARRIAQAAQNVLS